MEKGHICFVFADSRVPNFLSSAVVPTTSLGENGCEVKGSICGGNECIHIIVLHLLKLLWKESSQG
jgi:hypothetical protein